MDIEQRGVGPYDVWSGPHQSGELMHLNTPQFGTDDIGHQATRSTFFEALKLLFDLSDAGQERGGAYIRDSLGVVILTMVNEGDRKLLQEIDMVGFNNITIVEVNS